MCVCVFATAATEGSHSGAVNASLGCFGALLWRLQRGGENAGERASQCGARRSSSAINHISRRERRMKERERQEHTH